jgi:hypothetical protein
MLNFDATLPPSFLEKTIPGLNTNLSSGFNLDAPAPFEFDPAVAYSPDFTLSATSAPAWTFITAPEDISWSVGNQSTRIDMFGTNNPPVVAGARGMRDLKLGNALVEGFVRNVTVEDKVAALEKLMNYELNASDGFVKVPVYQVKANDKAYGNGYYIIRDVSIKETLRELKGNATRAYVDIDLMEVPAYQVNSGRDLASKPAAAAKALALPDPKETAAQQQAASSTSAKGRANQGVGTTTAAAGASSASAAKQPAAATPPRPAAVVPGQAIRYNAPPR